MKKLFSLFIALLCVGAMMADTQRVYCKMEHSWWTAAGAAVAIHYWPDGGSGSAWPGVRMTAVAGEANMWYFDLDTQYTNIIFVRVNGSGALEDWGAKTKNQTLPTDGKNLFTITNSSASWGDPGCDGTWSTYSPIPAGSFNVSYSVRGFDEDEDNLMAQYYDNSEADPVLTDLVEGNNIVPGGRSVAIMAAAGEDRTVKVMVNDAEVSLVDYQWSLPTLAANMKIEVMFYDRIDSSYNVAGNFTNWATGMQRLPYTINLPADSTLEFKLVKKVAVVSGTEELTTDLTWYGQVNNAFMTRESSVWTLNGENNVKLTTDMAGDYTFDYSAGSFIVIFPSISTSLEETEAAEQVIKRIENGQIVIIRNGMKYNLQGQKL